MTDACRHFFRRNAKLQARGGKRRALSAPPRHSRAPLSRQGSTAKRRRLAKAAPVAECWSEGPDVRPSAGRLRIVALAAALACGALALAAASAQAIPARPAAIDGAAATLSRARPRITGGSLLAGAGARLPGRTGTLRTGELLGRTWPVGGRNARGLPRMPRRRHPRRGRRGSRMSGRVARRSVPLRASRRPAHNGAAPHHARSGRSGQRSGRSRSTAVGEAATLSARTAPPPPGRPPSVGRALASASRASAAERPGRARRSAARPTATPAPRPRCSRPGPAARSPVPSASAEGVPPVHWRPS